MIYDITVWDCLSILDLALPALRLRNVFKTMNVTF